MTEIEVQLKDGKVTIQVPKAGARNKAIVEAYVNGQFNGAAFLIKLLPYCIVKHPWGTRKLNEAIDGLEITEYDKLMDVVTKFDLRDATKKVSAG